MIQRKRDRRKQPPNGSRAHTREAEQPGDCHWKLAKKRQKPYLTTPGENAFLNPRGNTRLQFRANTPGAYAIAYAADYLPFGKILREYPACNRDRFLSTHHERDTKTGYDNRGARLYDGEIGRFLGVDPLADMYGPWSPYNYVLGNPISHTDPDGRSVDTDIVDKNGKLVARVDDSTPDHVAVVKGSADKLQKQLADGKTTTAALIAGAEIRTTATIVRASAQVLDRTEKNGGNYEETALVEGGKVQHGERGGTDKGLLPAREGENGVGIHSHPINATVNEDGAVVSSSALRPSLTGEKPAGQADQDIFPNYQQNIIVGRLGNATKTSSGISQPTLGAAFYGRGEVKPQGTLTKSAMHQILRNRIALEAGL